MSRLVTAQLIETLGMGGAEHLAVQIANARASAGDRSHLYVLTTLDGPLAARVAPQVMLRGLGLERAPIRRLGTFAGSVVGGYRRLAAQVRADGVQVLQSHLPGANFWALLLAERRVCAVAATVHNTREFDYGDRDHPLRRRLRRLAYRRILRRCDATIAVSEMVKESLLAELGLAASQVRRFEVVTNGVEVPPALPPPERDALRARCGVAPDVRFLVTAGRLTAQKDFANLVAAADHLRRDGLRFVVVIGGEGELRGPLEDQVRRLDLGDVVRLPGNLVDLRAYLQAADLFVLPSRWEGLPLVLLEAMACGLPIAATRLEGLTELVEATGAGRLATPGDAVDLARQVSAMLADADELAACGRRAREVVRERYDFREVADALGRLYLDLAARRGPDSC